MKKLTKAQVIALAKNHGALTVTLFPSKCGPSNTVWVKGLSCRVIYENGELLSTSGWDIERFETVVNSFAYYNCNDELGKRVHYYVKEPVEQNYCDCEMCGAGHPKKDCLVD